MIVKRIQKQVELSEVRKLALEVLISDVFSKFFSLKQIRDEVCLKKYDIKLRELQHNERYEEAKLRIGKQLVYLFREFRDKGYIQKYSNRFWGILKDKIKKDINKGKKL